MSTIGLKDIRYRESQGKYTPAVSLTYIVHTTGTTLPTTTDPQAIKTICDMVLGAVGTKSFFNSYIESKEATLQLDKNWEVVVNLVDASRMGPETSANPLSQPARYSYAFEPLQKALDKCYGIKYNAIPTTWYDAPTENVVNTAGDWFDPPLQADAYLLTITVVKNQSSLPTNINLKVGCINDAAITIDGVTYPIYSVLFRFSSEDAYYTTADGIQNRYYVNTYQYTYNQDLWIRQILNAGLAYMDLAGVKHKSDFVVRLQQDGTKDGQQGPGGSFGYLYVADKRKTTLPAAPT